MPTAHQLARVLVRVGGPQETLLHQRCHSTQTKTNTQRRRCAEANRTVLGNRPAAAPVEARWICLRSTPKGPTARWTPSRGLVAAVLGLRLCWQSGHGQCHQAWLATVQQPDTSKHWRSAAKRTMLWLTLWTVLLGPLPRHLQTPRHHHGGQTLLLHPQHRSRLQPLSPKQTTKS